MKGNKKGVSIVVASVLLILITIAAAALIGSFVVPFVEDSLSGSTACFGYENYFELEEKIEFGGDEYYYNCYDDSGAYGAAVRARNPQGDLPENVIGFNLIFSGVEGTAVAKVRENGQSDVIKLTSGVEMIPPPGSVLTYKYPSSEIFNKIEVAPVLKGEKVCEVTDSIEIRLCEDNINL